MLGVGASKKTYLDDVFSIDLWKGDGSAHQVVNNINLSGEGGMVWTKARSVADMHLLTDTVRSGTNPSIFPNESSAEQTGTNYFSSINNNGFTTGTWSGANGNNTTFAGWTFRKAPGFFDVVTYTGNGSARTISHSLGSVPGCIMVKRLDSPDNWVVYHRGNADSNNASHYFLRLDTTSAKTNSSSRFNDTEPTASVFSVGTDGGVNDNGGTYVAYLFAGGESTAATGHSVDFDGSDDYLTVPSSSDLAFGTGDFTVEAWVKNDGGFFTIFDHLMGSDTFIIFNYANGPVQVYSNDVGHMTSGVNPGNGIWYHLAVVRESGSLQIYINGLKAGAAHSWSRNITQAGVQIGRSSNAAYSNGKISNLRVIKGTALYTSSFKPSTVPLTNISGTVLLCCNDTSATGATVKPGTITANSSPTGGNESPFDDPAGFVFGENEDQNIIKCGSYIGDSENDGPEINVGFEPQWILIKTTSAGEHWWLWDTMRGITQGDAGQNTHGKDRNLYPNMNSAEENLYNKLDITPTGFKIQDDDDSINANGDPYIYMCIRRPDGYVGKPAEAGTDVFAMDAGNGSSDIPAMDSGFPVDFALKREPASSNSWRATARLMGAKGLFTDTTGAEYSASSFEWDSNVGWLVGASSSEQSWMWKRHAGFDVVTANELQLGADIPHSLGKTPEMIIGKNRNNTFVWAVYHKGLNGGTNPEQYRLRLNQDDGEQDVTEAWNDTAPTATHFTVGVNHTGNSGGADYKPIFMLFASVDGISKVGYYDGSSSAQTITTGFQPRFVIIKHADGSGNPWYVLDTTRGWGSGNDKYLKLDTTAAQSDYDFGAPTSTGFTLNVFDGFNNSGKKYIYYAHA